MMPKNYICNMSQKERLQALASMYNELDNLMKDINLFFQNFLRAIPNTGCLQTHLLQKVAAFDNLLNKYNHFIIVYYTTTPLSIKVSPLAFGNARNCINLEKPFMFENEDYSIELLFQEQKKNEIWMSLKTWRKLCDYKTSNEILVKINNFAMRQFVESECKKEGFYEDFEGEPRLSFKKKFIRDKNEKSEDYDEEDMYLVQYLEFWCKDYLEFLEKLFSTSVKCTLCKKYLMYDSTNKIMEPPILKTFGTFQSFHHSCCKKFYDFRKYNQFGVRI